MSSRFEDRLPRPIAFVLSGGANLGSIQVGMLKALRAFGIHPDIVVGTSVGALNGAVVAAQGLTTAVERLEETWHELHGEDVFPGSMLSQAVHLMRTRLHLYSNRGIDRLIQNTMEFENFGQSVIPFGVTATELQHRRNVLFSEGAVHPALLASTAIPGMFPPVEIDGALYVDGGVTAAVPLGAAIRMGAKSLVVLDVGTICYPGAKPANITDLMLSVLYTAIRQRVLVEAPALAHRYPILYLPKPCSMDVSRLDFGHTAQFMAEAEHVAGDFLNAAPVPTPGHMSGGPHVHSTDTMPGEIIAGGPVPPMPQQNGPDLYARLSSGELLAGVESQGLDAMHALPLSAPDGREMLES